MDTSIQVITLENNNTSLLRMAADLLNFAVLLIKGSGADKRRYVTLILFSFKDKEILASITWVFFLEIFLFISDRGFSVSFMHINA